MTTTEQARLVKRLVGRFSGILLSIPIGTYVNAPAPAKGLKISKSPLTPWDSFEMIYATLSNLIF